MMTGPATTQRPQARSCGPSGNLPHLAPFPDGVSRQEAEAFCRHLANRHYENFTVVSMLLPSRLRQHFANVYAFCRVADDLADELPTPEESLARLAEWQGQLDDCYRGHTFHPVYVALQHTIEQFEIPREPFADLLSAFRQDQIRSRYQTWAELLDYCSRSANPVGRLVLHLCGYRDPERRRLSDCTCTALQLANFWQDISRDFGRGRVYIPSEVLREHGCSEEAIARRTCDARWKALMRSLVGRTRALFAEGMKLGLLIEGRTRLAVGLFSRGGWAVLQKIEAADYDTLTRRPHLCARDKWTIVMEELFRVPVRIP